MPRGKNAQLAADLFDALQEANSWTKSDVWKGIALLLLTCEEWRDRRWKSFHGCVVYRETNDFKLKGDGSPGIVLQRANDLSNYLASRLGVTREGLCSAIGQYWRHPSVSHLQPHNLVGHAFRSLVVEALCRFGNPNLSFEEEADPAVVFPGYTFHTRSENPRLDILARNTVGAPVAIISSRWRYRHDRVDIVDEAHAYVAPGRRVNPNLRLYAMVGEFNPARLLKILDNAPPKITNAVIEAAVHFCPDLISNGLKENGRLAHLKSLEWLIDETHRW